MKSGGERRLMAPSIAPRAGRRLARPTRGNRAYARAQRSALCVDRRRRSERPDARGPTEAAQRAGAGGRALEKPATAGREALSIAVPARSRVHRSFSLSAVPGSLAVLLLQRQDGDWLEAYARIMEIDFWGSTRCTAARYDEKAGEWTVTVTRGDGSLTLRPKQLVLATGLSGARQIPSIRGPIRFLGRHTIRPNTCPALGSPASAASWSGRTTRRTTSCRSLGELMRR